MIIHRIICDSGESENCKKIQDIEKFGKATPEYLAQAHGWLIEGEKELCICEYCQKETGK